MAEHALTTSTPIASRRSLAGGLLAFAAAASAVGITAGAAASVADLVPLSPNAEPAAQHSPIMAAGLQLKGCWERHDAADELGDGATAAAAHMERARYEDFILAATPTTVAECAVVLLIAIAEIDCGQNCDDGFDVVDAGQRVAERVTNRLFALAGLDESDFAGFFYMRESSVLAGRAEA